jgi:hypothetical protein
MRKRRVYVTFDPEILAVLEIVASALETSVSDVVGTIVRGQYSTLEHALGWYLLPRQKRRLRAALEEHKEALEELRCWRLR